MKVMTGRVVDGKVDVGDAQLEEGAAVALLVAETSEFQLTPDGEAELEAALADLRAGRFTDGRALLRDLRGLTQA